MYYSLINGATKSVSEKMYHIAPMYIKFLQFDQTWIIKQPCLHDW